LRRGNDRSLACSSQMQRTRVWEAFDSGFLRGREGLIPNRDWVPHRRARSSEQTIEYQDWN
jgi:hypothetical protein